MLSYLIFTPIFFSIIFGAFNIFNIFAKKGRFFLNFNCFTALILLCFHFYFYFLALNHEELIEYFVILKPLVYYVGLDGINSFFCVFCILFFIIFTFHNADFTKKINYAFLAIACFCGVFLARDFLLASLFFCFGFLFLIKQLKFKWILLFLSGFFLIFHIILQYHIFTLTNALNFTYEAVESIYTLSDFYKGLCVFLLIFFCIFNSLIFFINQKEKLFFMGVFWVNIFFLYMFSFGILREFIQKNTFLLTFFVIFSIFFILFLCKKFKKPIDNIYFFIANFIIVLFFYPFLTTFTLLFCPIFLLIFAYFKTTNKKLILFILCVYFIFCKNIFGFLNDFIDNPLFYGATSNF